MFFMTACVMGSPEQVYYRLYFRDMRNGGNAIQHVEDYTSGEAEPKLIGLHLLSKMTAEHHGIPHE